MTMDEILASASGVLSELMRELIRRGSEEHAKDQESQATACFSLAIRSASLLCGVGALLTPVARDSAKVLMRAFVESRDLLMTFRFDQKGTRTKIGYWLAGKVDSSWKAEHKKCEEFMDKLGHSGADFAKKWSQTTTLAHPTRYAADNSVNCAVLWGATPPRLVDVSAVMEPEIADYLTAIATLIVIATYDIPGLISLDCDLERMPSVDAFKENVNAIVIPILNKNEPGDLPPESYRS
jgi:hypothetical protein